MIPIMNVAETIYSRISEAFKPKKLEVVDESHLHAGHMGAREGGQTHYKVVLSAEAFAGMSRLQRSRALYKAVDHEELQIHALEFVFEDAA